MATVSRASPQSRKIPVRKITDEDLFWSLRQGLSDFGAMRGDILFAGFIYTFIGLAAVVMTTDRPLMPFFVPVVAGVGLLGPITAVGFYELARRRENGDQSNWGHFLDFLKRPSAEDIGIVAALLLVIFGLWLVAAGALYVALFGWTVPSSINAFITEILTTLRGWALIILGAMIGAMVGWVVLALSVVSTPMLVDCDISAGQAVSTSWRAAQTNRMQLLRWGLIVAFLLVLGSIPLFVGLAFVLPWLGYSTWHLYTRLIDRTALQTNMSS